MFAPHCPRHGTRVLLTHDDLTIRNTDHGIEIVWRCTCGHVGITRTGALAPTVDPAATRACA